MKAPARIYLFLFLFLTASCVFAQSKYDKYVIKAEAAYAIGDYSAAFKQLGKLDKKTQKKLGKQNKYTPKSHMMAAKYHLATGKVKEFESSLASAIASSIAINQDNSLEHAQILMSAAELKNMYGSFREAAEILIKAQSVLENGGWMKDEQKARWAMCKAETLTGQGYYAESISLLKENEPFLAARASRQETYVDEKGNLKSRRLSTEEAEQRFKQYASLQNLIAHAYGEQGNWRVADANFEQARGWIKKNLGESSIEFIWNQLQHANLLSENGSDYAALQRADVDYAKTLNLLKIKHKNSHYLSTFIYEPYLQSLLESNNSAKYLNTKLEYEKMINSSYDKGSIYPVRLRAIEFNSKLSKDKTRNLENDALNMLANKEGLPRNNMTTVHVLRFLYDLSIQDQKFSNAEKYLNDIIEIESELFGKDAPTVHMERVRLANYYIDYTNKLKEAEAIYAESFDKVVAKQVDVEHKDYLEILYHMASLYELTDKYALAVKSLGDAKLVARKKYSDTDIEYGIALNKIAEISIKLGLYEDAETNLRSSLKILEGFRKEDTKVGYLINALETQAILFGIQGLFDEAQDNLSKTSKMIAKADVLIGVDQLASEKALSSLYIQLGRYSRTEALLTGLIAEYEKQFGKNSLRLIEPLVNKGRLDLLKGDYTNAERVAMRANDIATQVYGANSTKTAPTQKLLSEIYYTIGDYDKAQSNIEKALASQEKQFGREHIEVAKSIGQLALIRFYKGDDSKPIEKLMLEARDIIGKRLSTTNPQYAEILKNVAVVYISEKRYDIAFSSLTQAETIWKEKTGSKNNINLASIYTLTGDVYYQLKNYPKSEEFYNKSIDLYRKFFSSSHPEYVNVLSKLAKVDYMDKDYKRAKRNIEEALANYDVFIKQYFPALSEREKAKYWNTIKGDFEFYNTLAFSRLDDFKDLAGKVYNYQLLTKALLLSSSIKIRERIMNSQDENLKASYNQWVQKKEFLTNALSMSTQQLTENEINTEALSQEVEQLEKELSQKSELFGQNFETKKITYENVQGALGKNDVAIEMVRFRYFDHVFTDSVIYVALYVKNDRERPKVVELPEGHRMETRFFKYYRNCITGQIPDQFSYQVFWEPIQREVGQYATIFLSPDGVYNQLNLEAIPTPDGKYVIDNSNIVLVSNTKDLYLRKIKSKPAGESNSATMFGNPTFYVTASSERSIPSLPGTEKEVAELQQLLKQKGWATNEYVETSASEERVKELDSPKIFHIATHGFYTPADQAEVVDITENEVELAENPLMKTGLLLKGAGDLLAKTKYNYNLESGILTAYEAMSLNLDKTDLVVLSACETGLGEISNGEGVYGLQRAFLVAGAKTLIMSMFKVDDAATQKLILSFYRKWLNTGNLRQSFIEAKKELRTEYPEPIYWGAFMMIGLD
ncbi:MAG: CHAT domain-containing protein [Cyclobacteriaceae bacterium]